MTIAFTKMHGAGNDFVLLDGRERLPAGIAPMARAIADRHFGVGCDQVLVVRDGSDHRFAMETWNADGSQAEMCGNGIRCFAKWLYDSGDLASGREVIETLGGPRWVEVVGYQDGDFRVRTGMGVPSFDPPSIPMRPGSRRPNHTRLAPNGMTLDVVGVSVGNPHAVAFVDDVDAFPLAAIGPLVERDDAFPERVNFEIVEVHQPSRLKVRVWERGAGLTLACGSGASASTVVAVAEGKVAPGGVSLDMPGGQLMAEWSGEGQETVLEGPASTVFVGEWADR